MKLAIFFIALALRCAYWVFLEKNYFFYDHPSADVLYYQQWALAIARGDWLGGKDFWGLPLYPYVLAIWERLALANILAVRFFHILLGSVNCVLTYAVARTLFPEKKAIAVLSGLLLACSFTAIHYDWLMMPVPVITALSLVLVLALLNDTKLALQERFVLGILLGLTALGDGKILIFIALISIYLFIFYQRQGVQVMVKVFVPLLVGFFLVLGANGLRHKIVSGHWIWISPQSGLSFYAGNHPQASGVFENMDFIRPSHQGQDADQAIIAQALAGRSLNPPEVSYFWRDQALAFILDNPREYGHLIFRKLALFVTETENSYDLDLLFQRDWKRYLDLNGFWLVCPLAMVGIVAARRFPGTIYPLGMILSQLVLTLIFFLTHRHRATILPFLLIYEVYAVFWLMKEVRRKNIHHAVMVLIAVALFMVALPPQALPNEYIDFYRFVKSGAVYEKKSDWVKAKECYQKALELRPQDTNAIYNLANVYTHSLDLDSARGLYEKILSWNPYQVDALYNLGFVQMQAGDYLQSLATFKRVAQLQPDTPDVLFQLGQVSQRLGLCAEANIFFGRLIQIRPSLTKEITPLMSQCAQSSSESR